jgi:hypothetical protein
MRELELTRTREDRRVYAPGGVGNALADGDSELAVFDGRGWGRRPVKGMVDETAGVTSGLLLFTAFVVNGLAEDASAGGAATTSAATAGGS